MLDSFICAFALWQYFHNSCDKGLLVIRNGIALLLVCICDLYWCCGLKATCPKLTSTFFLDCSVMNSLFLFLIDQLIPSQLRTIYITKDMLYSHKGLTDNCYTILLQKMSKAISYSQFFFFFSLFRFFCIELILHLDLKFDRHFSRLRLNFWNRHCLKEGMWAICIYRVLNVVDTAHTKGSSCCVLKSLLVFQNDSDHAF